ncbi:MAG: YfiR/HmsC family protein [Bacteroidales bacterium]|jgi:serine phosphatase RsbU (regulator of sigma subunit)|nr:YfiR/HmsC family protein [Bacteroidales bacterium]
MRQKLVLCLFFALLYNNVGLFSQTLVSNKERAGYIYEFIRQINWPNESSLGSIKMGVLDNSGNLTQEIRDKVAEAGKIRNKSINVLQLENLENLPVFQIIYLNKEWTPNVNVDSLMKQLQGKSTLLMTEAGQFRASMINFLIAQDGKMRYELNEDLLKKEGFTYSRILPFVAIKTKEDWESLFKETKEELDHEKEITSRQKKEIEEQELEIQRQQEEIQEQTLKISRQQEEIEIQQTRLTGLSKDISAKQEEIRKQDVAIEQQQQLLTQKQLELEEQNRINNEEITAKKSEIDSLSKQISIQLEKLHMQNVIILLGGLLVLFLSAFGIYIFINFRQKQRINRILQAKNEEIQKQNEEIKRQHQIVSEQRDKIAHQNKEITDSIIYARRIQSAVLPAKNMMRQYFDMFIFYRPRDIVSGDFYWMSQKEDKLIIVAADCTGHGVPGAFMSMLGIAFLNEIVSNEVDVYANNILNRLRENIIKSLNQTGKSEFESKDGMDIALCVLDYPSMTLQYAGAYNPLIMIRNNELIEIKADKMPVAYFDHGKETFTNHLVPLIPGDCLYMFSDGYADQFGGPNEKKFSSRRLKNSLLEIQDKTIKEQEEYMAKEYDKWKGDNEQIDDVLLIGIKI